MRLEIFNQANSQFWNNTVNQSINGTLSHTWEWLKIVEKHSDCKLIPLVFFDADDDKPFGAIPLFFMRKMGLKLVFSPPPVTAITLGPVLVDKGYKQHKFELAYLDFQTSLEKYIRSLKPNYIYISTSPGLLDVRPFSWDGYKVAPSYTYKINLSQGKNNVWKNLSQSLKTNIKNATKRGISISESCDVGSADYIYSSLKKRYAQQGRKMDLKLDYIKDILREFGRSVARIYLATYQGEIVGSDVCLTYKNTFVSWIGGCRNESNNIEANELIRWYSIEKAIREGYQWFEIEGANSIHLCDSKSRYCPEISIYFTLSKSDFIGRLVEKTYLIMKTTG